MTELEQYAASIEELAKRLGLDYYNVDFEVAPASLMTEIAVYGLPVRMPHWSFGVRYIHQLVRQSMIDVNLRGTLYGIAAALPVFQRQQSGHVINIVSTAGIKILPTMIFPPELRNEYRECASGEGSTPH